MRSGGGVSHSQASAPTGGSATAGGASTEDWD